MTTTLDHQAEDRPVDAADGSPDPRRWLALWIIAVAQLMVVLDAAIMNIAIPHAQADLDISTANRQWIITAYTVAFGGLLLLGGRVADYLGRKRAFSWGLLGFALASALGGLAPNAGLLFAARALQGAFGGVLIPLSFQLIVTELPPSKHPLGMALFAIANNVAQAAGPSVGGWLTDMYSWRWIFYLQIPPAIALVAAIGPVVERASRAGALAGTSGSMSGT